MKSKLSQFYNRGLVCTELVSRECFVITVIAATMTQCSICMDDLDDSRDEHTLSCSHRFHSACLLSWVLSGNQSCPLCRATTDQQHAQRLPTMALYARASYLRRTVVRRRGAPPDLVAIVRRVRHAEEHHRLVSKEFMDHWLQHKEEMKKSRRLKMRKWEAERRIRELKRLLGLFACPEYPLPLLSPY